jgi:hypothetical protein
MSKQITMKFWRDKYEGSGCLEYSWIPEGLRHNLNLLPRIQEGSSTDSIDDDLNPSHVQVYVASNNDAVSIEMWQFPSGPPKTSPVVSALILLFEEANLIVGTVFYGDGTIGSEFAKLDRYGRVCPQEPST